jgi:anti-sigma factor RsiW
MNGHVREELLALYLRNDLPKKDHGRVARHANDCPECQRTLADLSRSYELLARLFADPDQHDLVSVRRAVMRQIHAGGQGHRVWGLAAAAVVLLTVAFVLAWQGERQEPLAVARLPRPSPPAVILRTRPFELSTAPVVRARHKRIEPGIRTATLVTETGEPAYLKMKTSDPNVVILWQLQENEKVATP